MGVLSDLESFGDTRRRYLELIEEGIERYLPNAPVAQAKLMDAMLYSLSAPGKRLRPLLTLAFCEALGGDAQLALPFACAVEMVHCYSLIHDDLPCMDDDDLRRGRPSNHRMFGEASALLAGDALLSAAFDTMLDADNTQGVPAERVVACARCLAWASGAFGMAGGQQLDLEAENLPQTLESAALICDMKTGALLDAACSMGAISAGAEKDKLSAVSSYARCLGMAFQMLDDLENAFGSSADIGKPVGTDKEKGKLTILSVVGVDECKKLCHKVLEDAMGYLGSLGDTGFIAWLTEEVLGKRLREQ
jgi:geranylgeranyl diphosphate synthase type II